MGGICEDLCHFKNNTKAQSLIGINSFLDKMVYYLV